MKKISIYCWLVSLIFILSTLYAKTLEPFPNTDGFKEEILGKKKVEERLEEELGLAPAKKFVPPTKTVSSQSSSQAKMPPSASEPQGEVKKEEEPKEVIKRIDLDFTQANIEDVLRVIGEGGGFNIVVDPSLKGKKIDLHVKNVTIDEALELIFNAYGLGSAKIGNSLFIATKEKIVQRALTNKVIKLENVRAESVADLLKDIVESVTSNKEMNSLVIIGTPSQIEEAEKIIAKLDIPQPQVLLATQVLEIDADALRELGIDWSDAITLSFQETKRPLGDIGEDTIPSSSGPLLKIFKFERTPIQFNTIIKMLETENKAKVLSNPRITTMNEKEAEIFIGDKVPYTITTVTGGVANTEVRFAEAGIRLKITPSIIEEDFVVVKIEPEVSYIYTWRGPEDQYPWIRTREATAYVRVRDSQPFILGGLISQEDKKNIYKVPLLSQVPIFGNLFKYEKTTSDDKEIIISVTPQIVR
ncbi:MAG: hypothetical protein DRP80_05225 [Candidatus Omnitrophota bacterium]|nr:MAG: hypothetical protein DRP80_05225 [Candidatus Omnitrophota bacterium]